MQLDLDEKVLESQLDGMKKLSDMGGKDNTYPTKYRQLRDNLAMMGLKVTEICGKHTIT